MDRNDYYGGESTSLNLNQVFFLLIGTSINYKLTLEVICQSYLVIQLWKRFRGEDKPPEQLGSSREYNVDMVPKVLIVFVALWYNLVTSVSYKCLNQTMGACVWFNHQKTERKQKFVALGIVHKSVLEILMFLYDTLVAMAWMKVIMASSPWAIMSFMNTIS